jgi:hypothetical protein
MGLQSRANENVRKGDVSTSKNYLSSAEIKELNRVTTILLDIFEDQSEIGRLIVMSDTEQLLDNQLHQLGRAILRTGGSVTSERARQHAELEYERFDAQRKLQRQREADENIAALASEAKKLHKARR